MVFANIICLYTTEVYVKVGDGQVKKLTAHPYDLLGTMVFNNYSDLHIEEYVVVLEDNVVPMDTKIVTLFNKTSSLKYLKVLSEISELDDSYK